MYVWVCMCARFSLPQYYHRLQQTITMDWIIETIWFLTWWFCVYINVCNVFVIKWLRLIIAMFQVFYIDLIFFNVVIYPLYIGFHMNGEAKLKFLVFPNDLLDSSFLWKAKFRLNSFPINWLWRGAVTVNQYQYLVSWGNHKKKK